MWKVPGPSQPMPVLALVIYQDSTSTEYLGPLAYASQSYSQPAIVSKNTIYIGDDYTQDRFFKFRRNSRSTSFIKTNTES